MHLLIVEDDRTIAENLYDYLEARGQLDGAHEMRGVTFGRYVRALVLGPQNDAERRALAGGTDSAGGYNYLTQVTIEPIPYTESDNAAGGTTVTIA